MYGNIFYFPYIYGEHIKKKCLYVWHMFNILFSPLMTAKPTAKENVHVTQANTNMVPLTVAPVSSGNQVKITLPYHQHNTPLVHIWFLHLFLLNSFCPIEFTHIYLPLRWFRSSLGNHWKKKKNNSLLEPWCLTPENLLNSDFLLKSLFPFKFLIFEWLVWLFVFI